jgi:uncharacterized membrane protein YkoI
MKFFDILKIIAIALAVQLAGAALASRADAKATDCLDDWSKAAPVVRDNGLTPAKDLKDLAKGHVAGDLKSVSLCKDADAYVYELVFIQTDGNVVELTVDAKKPW